MKITSIYNYTPDNNNIAMLKTWLYLINKNAPDLDISIKTDSGNSTAFFILKNLQKKFHFRIETGKYTEKPIYPLKNHGYTLWNHNVNFKLWNNCLETEPYIFIDLDAFLLKSIAPLLKASLDQPFVAVEHEVVLPHTGIWKHFFSCGVLCVSDPKILNFDAIRSTYYSVRKKSAPGAEQSLLNLYFKENKLNWQHKDIGLEWNSWAGFCAFDEQTETCWSSYPPNPHPVSIIHYWWTYKPWTMYSPPFEYGKTL